MLVPLHLSQPSFIPFHQKTNLSVGKKITPTPLSVSLVYFIRDNPPFSISACNYSTSGSARHSLQFTPTSLDFQNDQVWNVHSFPNLVWILLFLTFEHNNNCRLCALRTEYEKQRERHQKLAFLQEVVSNKKTSNSNDTIHITAREQRPAAQETLKA